MDRLLAPAALAAIVPTLAGTGPCTSEEAKIDSLVAGGTANVCPCFVPGEVTMTILDTPSGGTATLSKIQIFWQSAFGGQPDILEQAIIIYDMNQDGPVDPGTFDPLCSEAEGCILLGPVLADGFLNEFNVLPLGITLPENRFGIGLEFLNQNAGNLFAPSVVSDDDGHNDVGGIVRNWVFVIPGGWFSSEALGVTGDWVIRAVVEVCEDQPPCPWDVSGNGQVDVPDLLSLLGQWNLDPGGPPDFDGNGAVDVADLLKLLGQWGPCPQ